MKDLFERYEKKSLEAEKILRESMDLVLARKTPRADLSEQIGSIFKELNAAYDEIIGKLPEQMGDILPDTSVRDLEQAWQNCVAKQQSLKAVLSEFIRVYSDESRYMEAILPQLEAAKGFLAQMEEDEQAAPDVSSYVIFLECVKQDLDENEALSNMLEDDGIPGFPNRAISGLQKKKYHIRDEGESAEVVPETEDTKEAAGEVVAEPAVESKIASEEETPEQTAKEPIEYLHPKKPIVSMKIPSEPKFDELMRKTDRLFGYLYNHLTFLGLLDKEHLLEDVEILDLLTPERARELLDYLESKGFLCTYEYEGREILCATELLHNCLSKKSIQNLIKRRFNIKSPRYCLIYGAKDFNKEDFISHLVLADQYCRFSEKLNEREEYLSLFPQARWDKVLSRYVLVCPPDPPKINSEVIFTLVSPEEMLVCGDDLGNKLICYSKELPELYLPAEGVFYACLADDGFYCFSNGEWVKTDNVVLADSAAEITDKEQAAMKGEPVNESEKKVDVESDESSEDVAYIETLKSKVRIEVVNDTPMSEARSSKFLSRAKDHFEAMVMTLVNLMYVHLFPADRMPDFYENCPLLYKNELEYLLAHGYAAIVEFNVDGNVEKYYAPSSKAYACVQKADVSRFLKSVFSKTEYHKMPKDLIPLKEWSPSFIYHCKLLVDYLVAQEDNVQYYIERSDQLVDLPCCISPDPQDNPRVLVAGALIKGCENAELDFLSAPVILDSSVNFVVLVEGKELISRYEKVYVERNPDRKGILKYAIVEDPMHVYNGSGEIIQDLTEEVDDEDYDGNDLEDFTVDDLEDLYLDDETGEISTVEDSEKVNSKQLNLKTAEQQVEDSRSKESQPEVKAVSDSQPVEKKTKPVAVKKESKSDLQEELSAEVPAIEPPAPSQSAQQIIKAKGAFAVGRMDVGNVILKGVCEIDNSYEKLAKQYSFATGDPANIEDYRPTNLLKYFPEGNGKDPENDLLFMASWLRMYFSEEASFESYLAREKKHMEGNLSNKFAPSLTDAVNALAEWTKNQGRGLDQDLLASALKHSGIADRLEGVRKQAKELLDSGELLHSTHYTNRIKATRENLFGRNSDLYRQLQVVIQDDRSELQKLKAELERYVTIDNGVISVHEDEIEDLMDDTWRGTVHLAKGKGQSDALTGVERNTLRNKLTSVYRLLGSWILAASTSKTVSTAGNAAVVSLVDRIKPKFQAAIGELEPKGEEFPELYGPLAVLKYTLEELLQRIRCEFNEEMERKYYYAQLMKEPFVAIDEDYLPYIESTREQVELYEFCDRAAQYLSAEDKSWEDVIKRIFNSDEARNGADYGIARLLKEYLNELHPEVHWPAEYDIDRAIERALDKNSKRSDSLFLLEQNFTARLEMADGDGWFTSTASREKIDKIRNANYEAYCMQDNFGFYGRKLNHILDVIKSKAPEQRPAYMQRLEKLKDSFSEEDQTAPIFVRIEKLIKDDRFGAAESYLQQVERGMLDLRNNGLGDPKSEFNMFIKNSGVLCWDAALGKKMVDSFRSQHKGLSNKNFKTGEDLLVNWPESKVHPDTIKRILGDLGLETERVTGDKQDGHYLAFFSDKGRIENYPHPIADFGSKMYKQGLDINLIFGAKNSDEFFTEINAILQKTSSRPVLILCNFAIPLQERRKLAKKIANNLRTTAPCLLVDRALAYYLADRAMTERWNIMIQCALPFQPAQLQNPYFENSSVEIPPDMFIGRREELSSIIDSAGANLIYGGRQLGKTALLQRAKTLQHQPLLGTFSAYVDIKNMDSAEAAKTIGKSLIQCGFLMQDTKIKNWTDLVDAIELRLMARTLTDHRLLLLIDEADHFLVQIESNKYKELDQFKRLQGTTEGRFKFVMAGLHNVLRFSQKALSDNSGLPQLQGITVKPLSFADARELLEIPLSYLGFMIRSGEEDVIAQILYNTNYFPGLVHFYASRLVKYMQKNMQQGTMPPYTLDREVLTRVLTDEDFRHQRVQRLKMTLGIDADQHSYYDALAHILCYYSLAYEEVMLYGMTAAEIRKECKDLAENSSIAKLDEQSIEALLDELVELNIFRPEVTEGKKRYLFSRTSFIEMLGTREAVESHLLEILEK